MARRYKQHTYYGVIYSYYVSNKKSVLYDIEGGLTLREARRVAKYIMMKNSFVLSATVVRMIYKIDKRSGEDNFEKV